ncbi:MAG: hypothetical protein IGS54_02315 [Elainella sp. C42_A2020_010]|nr:hypothetical protein [Elainella sp. C42_A2020_010]
MAVDMGNPKPKTENRKPKTENRKNKGESAKFTPYYQECCLIYQAYLPSLSTKLIYQAYLPSLSTSSTVLASVHHPTNARSIVAEEFGRCPIHSRIGLTDQLRFRPSSG